MRALLCVSCLILSACVTVRTLQIEPVEPDPDRAVGVSSPVKVHLVDGSTVVFNKGITVYDGKVMGEGFLYDTNLKLSEPVIELSLDDVAAMESFQTPVSTGATAVASTGAVVGGGAGGIMLLKVLFGSCPTTYSMQDDAPVLEAESFSYSIAPGFEARDVDRLGIGPHSTGMISLDMRNEALETHYINHVELLAVEHGPDTVVYNDPRHRPLILRDLRAPVTSHDNSGPLPSRVLAAADGDAWQSPDARLARITDSDFTDFVEATFDAPRGQDSVALVVRARNSLLNTVLLYDIMLQEQGLHAIDWMGRDLNRLGERYRLARWYKSVMGMRVLIRDGGRWRPVEAAPDTGPIAWKEFAVRLPKVAGDTIRVRIEFVADNWRIDRLALGEVAGRASFRQVPLARVDDITGAGHDAALENLLQDDRRYVITQPGDRLQLQFDSGAAAEGRQRTFFLAASGYYIEWMRKDWLEGNGTPGFEAGDGAVLDALYRWRDQRDGLREQFDNTRINVR